MKLKQLLDWLEAMRSRQYEYVATSKTNPHVYEQLLGLPVTDVVAMFERVDLQLEEEKLEEEITRLKRWLKNGV